MKKIFLMIVIITSFLITYGQKTYVQIKENVDSKFNGETVTLYKNEILEKNEQGNSGPICVPGSVKPCGKNKSYSDEISLPG